MNGLADFQQFCKPLEERIAELEDALRRHGRHDEDCYAGYLAPKTEEPYPCICGYAEIQASLGEPSNQESEAVE